MEISPSFATTHPAQSALDLSANGENVALTNDNSLLLEQVTNALVKNVAASSRRIYLSDARQFLAFLTQREVSLATATFTDVSEYRAWLDSNFKKATAARMLTVARRLLEVAVILELRLSNPAHQIKGFNAQNGPSANNDEASNDTPHRALTKYEARDLLLAIDRTTTKGKRDFALIMLLLRTGLRRSEAAALTLSDLKTQGGYTLLTVRYAKGGKSRIAKLPADVVHALKEYLEAINCQTSPNEMDLPLFVSFRRGHHPTTKPLNGLAIERIVEEYAAKANLSGLTPHGLRASFVTLALEGGARLQQVQYAVGHSDPRTTERYQKRKLNLADNATDYIHLPPLEEAIS